MKWLIGLPALFLVGIPSTLLGGKVFSDLWRWFVVDVFDVPALSYAQAVGLLVLIGFCRLGLAGIPIENEDETPILAGFQRLFVGVFGYLVCWGVGAFWNWVF